MKNNIYDKVKDFVQSKLHTEYTNKGFLNEDEIEKEIEKVKRITSDNVISTLVFNETNILLDEDDFRRMKYELEALFDVKMEEGIIMKGENQKKRDTTWWSDKEKISNSKYYWNRYKKYLSINLPPEVIKTIDDDTDVIMNNIGNPNEKEFNIFGMVVGHVQSGKTANYSSLLCKAADAGYKFIVVIAGDKNNLRNQTQKRINEAFVGRNALGNKVGVGLIDDNLAKLPKSLTTEEKDFNTQDANRNSQGTNFDNINAPILLVIKKNTSTLTNIISWIKNQYNNKITKHSMLVIDDESDYASINTRENEDPTTINRKIRALLETFHKSSYIAYTATPYANIFIDHQIGEIENVYVDRNNININISRDLFPSDFIYALDAPTNYFGARKIFLENREKFIVEIFDYEDFIPMKHKKDFYLEELPPSLYKAIRSFLINVAIRNLRGQGNKHNTMLVHISRFSDIHARVAILINRYIEKIKDEIIAFGKLDNAMEQSNILKNIFDTYKEYYNDIEYSWSEILNVLVDKIETILVREEHQKSKLRVEYRDDIASNIIAVGGISLSRGFTLEGLSISYFIRSTIFYDTLMQMGRWFGYRTGYEDICKIFIPASIADYFQQIIESTEELMLDFKEMSKEDKTPLDFGLAVRQHPDSILQVTARNKRKNTKKYIHRMNLNGALKETVRFDKDNRIHENNFIKLSNFIDNTINKGYKFEENHPPYVWRNIDKNEIYSFLKEFNTYQTDALGAQNLMPIKHILTYLETKDINWDVVLYSGTLDEISFGSAIKINKEKRKTYKEKNEYYEIGQRKLSSGNPEIALLDEEEKKNIAQLVFERGKKTKYIRKLLVRPALMLHVIKTPFNENLPGFGVCFPDTGFNDSQTVEYLVNTVYIQNIIDNIKNQEENDDE